MAVLRANATLVLDALWPVNNERIVRPAFAVGIGFPVLERSVGRLRPAQRIVATPGFRRADLVDLGQVIGDILLLGHRFADNGTVDAAFFRSFLAGAVIADGDEDQRVVELSDLLQVID